MISPRTSSLFTDIKAPDRPRVSDIGRVTRNIFTQDVKGKVVKGENVPESAG